ncbi:bifunctional endoribonuclease/protein kinase ire1, partial [Linderina macrospora]
GDGDGEFDAGDDGDDEEEEWLLEQGIDWRSDPQVLERQRQQRREWLARQRKKARSRRHGSRYPEPSADSDGSESEDVLEVLYIAEPAGSGMLFLYDSENGLQRLPLTIQTLVDQSPVQSNGVLYTGNKDSNFASIDLLTGKLIGMYGDEHRSKKPRAQIQILLGERINRVRIYPVTGNGGFYNRAPQHELYHRFVNTPSIDPAVDAILTEIGDAVEASYSAGGTRHSGADDEDEDVVFQPQPHGPTKFVMTHDGGLVMVEAATGIPLWAQEFDAPVVSMFDVFSIASPDSDGDSDSVNYVARKRNLNPSAQQNRYLRWKRLYEVDDEFDSGRGGGRPGFGSSRSKSQQSKWRTGSAGGNILAESFWDRSATSHVHVAYVGRLQDTLYTLTTDEFPLVDHQTLTSSLLLALAQAKRNQHRYPAFQSPEWWDRWSFLTHDATVLRVLQDARAWWMRPVTPAETSSSSAAAESAIAANGAVADPHVGELMELVAKHFDSGEAPDAASYVVPQDRQVCLVGRCNVNGIIGVHPFRPYPAQLAHIGGSGAPTFNPYLLDPGAYDEDEQ